MSITIAEYTVAMTEGVKQFNDRLKAGGLGSRFPTSPIHGWPLKMTGRKLFAEYYLALDEKSIVRGAYILKHQEFWIGGQTVSIGDFTLPISEGTVDGAYRQVGVKLLLDAERRQPVLYCLGMGGYNERLPRLLKAARWEMFSVPFFFKIIRPFPFLRNIVYLRRSVFRRCLLDILAFTGLGWVAIKGLLTLCYRGVAQKDSVAVETVDEFSGWADELWEGCKDQYGMSAVRDGTTLRILYPRDQKKFIRLKITQQGKVIGWAVLLNTQLSEHRQFGNMRLGSIVDCFASPPDAERVIGAAKAVLEKEGVDLMVSNQSHAAWCRALRACGFMRGPSNSIFAASKELTQLLRTSGTRNDEIHLNRGDGDGPSNL